MTTSMVRLNWLQRVLSSSVSSLVVISSTPRCNIIGTSVGLGCNMKRDSNLTSRVAGGYLFLSWYVIVPFATKLGSAISCQTLTYTTNYGNQQHASLKILKDRYISSPGSGTSR